MKRALGSFALLCLGLLLAACNQQLAGPPPRSRAVLTDFTETSRLDDVNRFYTELAAQSPLMRRSVMGKTNEGREMPLVMLSDPPVATPADAKKLGRPVVFIMANIHAGEVEGKEAVQNLAGRMLLGDLRPLLKQVVTVIAPDYNADGNEKIDINNRTAQYGPIKGVGVRENAQGLDLNRDFIKIDAPETLALIRLFNEWDPLVTVDLHTTNGSYHGYHLTYSIPLHPGVDEPLAKYHRDTLMPALAGTMLKEHSWRTYYYGNFNAAQGGAGGVGRGGGRAGGAPATAPGLATSPAVPPGQLSTWYAFTHAPRIGQNYVGFRNRFAILSEAYSYLHFKERIAVTESFVEEILQYVAANGKQMQQIADNADKAAQQRGSFQLGVVFEPRALPQPVDLLIGEVTREVNPLNNRPMTANVKDKFRIVKGLDYGMFAATRSVPTARAYVFRDEPVAKIMLQKLRAHGVEVETLTAPVEVECQHFTVAQMARGARPFQGHSEVSVAGTYTPRRVTLPAGAFVVRANQRLGFLAAYLMEPESDDGFTRWGFLDEAVAEGKEHPVLKVMGEFTGRTRRVE